MLFTNTYFTFLAKNIQQIEVFRENCLSIIYKLLSVLGGEKSMESWPPLFTEIHMHVCVYILNYMDSLTFTYTIESIILLLYLVCIIIVQC